MKGVFYSPSRRFILLFLLASRQQATEQGSMLGLLGAIRNGGKVAGPVVAGALIARFDFILTFNILGVAFLAGVGFVL